MKITFNKNHLAVAFCLFFLCVGTFHNSLSNPFLMDDHALIVENRAIKDIGFLQLGHGRMSADGENVYFRPLTHLLDLIPYLLFGRDAVGFHIFNLFSSIYAVSRFFI